MTMKDKQNDKQFEKALKNMTAPPADKQAKKRAINLAMAEFESHQSTSQKKEKQNSFQGFAQWRRPIGEITTRIRRLFMNAINNKTVYSALGSVCVAVLCFGLLYSMMPREVNRDVYRAVEEREITSKDKKSTIQPSTPVASDNKPRPLGRGQLEEVVVAEQLSNSPAKEIYDHATSAPSMPNRSPMVLEETVVAAVRQKSENLPASSSMAKQMRSYDHLGSIMVDEYIEYDDVIVDTYEDEGRDDFESFEINPVKQVSEEPVSTFSVDVDTSSYSFVRRQLNSGYLPQKDAVRAEEMINYFDYNYDVPASRKQPFKPNVYVTPTPWNKNTKLIHIGIKGYEIKPEKKPASNLVFLLDVSGSMNSPDKLPLVKQSMSLLLDTLNNNDTVSIVVYAGAAGTVLEPTKASEKQTILSALNRLQAGGSTAGAQGIKLAYQLAEANFEKDAVNRVILATDGDFNVGITNNNQLQNFIERKRDKGIFLSILGFGQGNYKDHRMQRLAQNGNGVAAYIDTLSEAQKVLVDEASSMLFPIAKDVKIQVEFNPDTVSEYRLIGYETRHLNREDFNNDKVDAGDIGAGHTVTAIYEVTPANSKVQSIDENRYQQQSKSTKADYNGEYAFLKIRYKLPDETKSKLITQPINFSVLTKTKANKDVQFATAVAAFAQILQGGKYTGDYSYDDIIKLAQHNKGADEFGYRTEFIQLVRKAKIAAAM